ncbi:glycosyltransferase family 4 protein [Fluviicola chungangensis]|uniref:Glycosyltransferase family 4 protein n=1 Tax=Fluviicola chungangensis TaxID=2597671 RepID=A0A556MIX7_9FLAO|nr:glycosyltransferase family 4 protein [Fluviicola chungangensis]TSJ39871.1 glycosyltransferase family 4 protein [Fluviicola chungangensis]
MIRKKVCYIISDIDKAVFFELTAKQLCKHVGLSFILINSKNSALSTFLKTLEIPVYHISCPSILRSTRSIMQIRRILRNMKPDCIHCHLAHANWTGLIAGSLSGIKQRIYTRHSGKPLQWNWKEAIIDFTQNRLATDIIAISRNIEHLLLEQKVPASKIHLIYHGFNTTRFANPDPQIIADLRKKYNPENQYPLIGVIARNVPWKGTYYTLQAFTQLLKSHPNAKICLFGGHYTSMDSIWDTLCEIPERNKQIIDFEPAVFDIYSLFDVYVHVPVNPSCEAFGQTYVEAIMSNTPSVFTLSGIAPEIVIHKQNAYVVPFKNAEEILQGISYWLNQTSTKKVNDPELQAKINDMFSMKRYLDSLLKIYKPD